MDPETTIISPKTPSIGESIWEIIRFVLIIVIIVVPIRVFIAQPFIVSGRSMDPTFADKQYLIIDELSYFLRSPVRGEVIVFKYPKDPSKYFIKRIIGLPSETVKIDGQKITITKTDGTSKVLEEDYASITNGLGAVYKTFELGQDEYFVVGDNRDWSLDSRAWGPVDEDLIRGRAFLRLFPFTTIDYLPGSINN
jgi:signal peptidase I